MVSAGIAKSQGYAVNALTIDYNQRHSRELESADLIARTLGAQRHVVLPLDLRQFGGSALTSDIDVPKEGVGQDIRTSSRECRRADRSRAPPWRSG